MRKLITDVPPPPFYSPRRWEGAAAALAALAVFLIFAYFGQPGRGSVAGAFLGSVVVSMRICWPIRNEIWYRLAISIVIIIHIALVIGFQWKKATNWNGFTMIPFMTVDIAIILSVMYFLYKAIHGEPKRLFTDSEPDYSE